MPFAKILLFEFGTEGGGASVYTLPDNTVIEKGSCGGILDDEEDSIKEWEKVYDNWDAWWSKFTSEHQEQWIYFYPIFIHTDIKKSIKIEIDRYVSNFDTADQKEKWNRHLSKIM